MSSVLPPPPPAAAALQRLREGNARFRQNLRSLEALTSQSRREDLTEAQAPLAVVLSCSDSRVPSEIVFDCGLGELFVVRVAGNVCAPSLVGSVEFAAAAFGTSLVVVMGHTRCGAVSATLRVLDGQAGEMSTNIRDIVDRISPAVRMLYERREALGREEMARAAVRANVLQTVSHLRHGSRLLEERSADGRLSVVAAEYSLETGAVEFFDLPPSLEAIVAPG